MPGNRAKLTINGNPMPETCDIGDSRLKLLARLISKEELEKRWEVYSYTDIAKELDVATGDIRDLGYYYELPNKVRVVRSIVKQATDIDALANRLYIKFEPFFVEMVRKEVERQLNN